MEKLEANLLSLALLLTRVKVSILTFEKILQNKEYLNQIEFDEEFYKKVGFQKSLRGLLAEHMVIQFCSFLDEYKKFNPTYLGFEYLEKIKKVRSKNKYGMNRINEWKNLYDYRNQIAAHNFDVKKQSILLKKDKVNYSIPTAYSELYLFFKICEKINQNIYKVFPEFIPKVDLNFKLKDKVGHLKDQKFNLEFELDLLEKNMY